MAWVLKRPIGIDSRLQQPSDQFDGENYIVTKSTRVDGNFHPGMVPIGFARDPLKLPVTINLPIPC